jgi:hypothetical protein
VAAPWAERLSEAAGTVQCKSCPEATPVEVGFVKTPHYIDCCRRPELRVQRTLYEAIHDLEALHRCASCGTYWFYRFHEYVDWAAGDDDLTSWFTALTGEEGERLRNMTDHDAEDLSFLATRSSWRDDKDGVERVDGAPGRPWS